MAALLVRVIPVLGHLSYSLHQYKKTIDGSFAEFLQEECRNTKRLRDTASPDIRGSFFKGKR